MDKVSPEFKRAFGKYIADRHCSLWMEWEVANPSRYDLAQQWAYNFYSEMTGRLAEEVADGT